MTDLSKNLENILRDGTKGLNNVEYFDNLAVVKNKKYHIEIKVTSIGVHETYEAMLVTIKLKKSGGLIIMKSFAFCDYLTDLDYSHLNFSKKKRPMFVSHLNKKSGDWYLVKPTGKSFNHLANEIKRFIDMII